MSVLSAPQMFLWRASPEKPPVRFWNLAFEAQTLPRHFPDNSKAHPTIKRSSPRPPPTTEKCVLVDVEGAWRWSPLKPMFKSVWEVSGKCLGLEKKTLFSHPRGWAPTFPCVLSLNLYSNLQSPNTHAQASSSEWVRECHHGFPAPAITVRRNTQYCHNSLWRTTIPDKSAAMSVLPAPQILLWRAQRRPMSGFEFLRLRPRHFPDTSQTNPRQIWGRVRALGSSNPPLASPETPNVRF